MVFYPNFEYFNTQFFCITINGQSWSKQTVGKAFVLHMFMAVLGWISATSGVLQTTLGMIPENTARSKPRAQSGKDQR